MNLEALGLPLLTIMWAFPLLMAFILRGLGESRVVAPVAVVVGVLELWFSGSAVSSVRAHGGLQLEERLAGLPYHLGVDGTSALFLPVVALLSLLVTLYGWHVRKTDYARWQAWVFVMLSTLMGMFLSLDLLLFWAFSVAELLPVSALLMGWGVGQHREQAKRRYLQFMGSSVFSLLAGALLLAWAQHQSAGIWSFDVTELGAHPATGTAGAVAFFLVFYGLAIRAPLFPFHGWLPAVIAEGPVVGLTVFLLGAKVSIYAILRFVLPLTPEAAWRFAPWILGMSLISMVWAGLIALVQTDLRRLLAYSAISHSGLVLLGVFTLNHHGLEGALLESLNLGVAAAGLYFVAGFFYERLNSSDLASLGGLWEMAPLLSLTFLVVAGAGVGMPGTPGFDALHLLIEGAMQARRFGVALFAGLGTVLGAAVLLWYYQRAFLASPTDGKTRSVPDLRFGELVIAATLCALIGLVGIYAQPWLETIEHATEDLSERLARPQHHGPISPNAEASNVP